MHALAAAQQSYLVQQVLCCHWQVIQDEVDPVFLVNQHLEFLQGEGRYMCRKHRTCQVEEVKLTACIHELAKLQNFGADTEDT